MEHLESQLPAMSRTLERGRARQDRRDRPAGHERQPERHAAGIRRGSPTPRSGGAERASAGTGSGAGVRIFSGIQPTGRKHLGNYIGAIAQYVEAQERGEGALLHRRPARDHRRLRPRRAARAPVRHDRDPARRRARPEPLHPLPPERRARAHRADLAAVAASPSSGACSACTSSATSQLAQRELVSAGLLLYPVLQAADVLAYRAEEVPVGEDQREHLELMRDVARRFNARFGDGEDVLVVPEHRIPEVGARIMDLQDPDAQDVDDRRHRAGHRVRARRARRRSRRSSSSAVTDSGSEVRRAPEKPGVSNLIEILAAVRGVDPAAIEAEFADARATATSRRPWPRRSSTTSRRCASATSELRADEAALEAMLARRRGRARARSPRRRSPTCASAWASAPPRGERRRAGARAPRRARPRGSSAAGATVRG